VSNRVIAFTTDFGSADAYVAAMKGVALGIVPDLTFVDITHEVPPQDIAHGAFVLGNAYQYFPFDTIHVAVVDPGVGTRRKAVLLVTPTGSFVAPDNGMLSYVLKDYMTFDQIQFESTEFAHPVVIPVPPDCQAYELTNPEYWRHTVSSTFHGRDIFAPVAVYLASGAHQESVGESIHELTLLNLFTLRRSDDRVEGQVIYIDRFGNLVSNIQKDWLPDGEIMIDLEGGAISGLSRTFSDADSLLALIGSHGYLEVAENGGSAASRLGVEVGATITIRR
jgi:S-adenosylmethionine hydrolase